MPEEVVAACSGGPDSMALLDQLRRQGYLLHVVHINYHQRSSAGRDEQIVRDYCQRWHLDLQVLDAHFQGGQNFQSWARTFRYQAFFDMARRYDCRCIYVAHHLDDHIETYLFQKQNHRLAENFGLASTTWQQGFVIRRPLLSWQKKELEAYCRYYSIPYGIDESNLTDHYTRNKIRHAQVEPLARQEKMKLADRIEQENKEWHQLRKNLPDHSLYEMDASILEEETAWLILDEFLYPHLKTHLPRRQLLSLCSQLKTPCLIQLPRDIGLERWGSRIFAGPKRDFHEVIIQNPQQLMNFSADLGLARYHMAPSGQTIETFAVNPEDFPLTIRPMQPGDRIALRTGHKKVHRFFIDRRIPRLLRQQWLVVADQKGEIIFLPGLGCSLSHFCTKQLTGLRLSMLQCYAIKFRETKK